MKMIKMEYKNIKWRDNMKDYELQVRNVGMKNNYPIQIVLEVWDGNRTRRTFVDIPRDKTKEFLEIINEINKQITNNNDKNRIGCN